MKRESAAGRSWWTTEEMGLSHSLMITTIAYCGVQIDYYTRYQVTHEKPKCGICKERLASCR